MIQAVLFGQGEVLIIVIVTGLVVWLVMRKKKQKQ